MTLSDADLRRKGLSSFLRNRRSRLTPQQVGMAPGARRRTPGLRREELALLAGVGVTWYTWLEQGRDIHPSPEVLASLARTLRLDQAESAYLFHLAGEHPPPSEPRLTADVPQPLMRLVQAQSPLPAFLMDAGWDVRAWNEQAEALFEFARLPVDDRNLAWMVFTNEAHRRRTVDWDQHAYRAVAQLRAAYGEHAAKESPAAGRLAGVIGRLRVSFPEADRWLDEHEVQERSGSEKDLDHETVGLLRLDQLVLHAPGELQLVVHTARDSVTVERLRALAS